MKRIMNLGYVILVCIGITFSASPCHAFGFPTFDIAEVGGTIKGVVTDVQSLVSTVQSTISQSKLLQSIGDAVGAVSKFRDENAEKIRQTMQAARRLQNNERLAKLRKKLEEKYGNEGEGNGDAAGETQGNADSGASSGASAPDENWNAGAWVDENTVKDGAQDAISKDDLKDGLKDNLKDGKIALDKDKVFSLEDDANDLWGDESADNDGEDLWVDTSKPTLPKDVDAKIVGDQLIPNGKIDASSNSTPDVMIKTPSSSSSGGMINTSSSSSSGGMIDTASSSSSGGMINTSSSSSSGGMINTSSSSSSGGMIDTASSSSSGGMINTVSSSSSGGMINTSSSSSSGGDLVTIKKPTVNIRPVNLIKNKPAGNRSPFTRKTSATDYIVLPTSYASAEFQVYTGTNEEGRFLFSDIIAQECKMSYSDAENTTKVKECIKIWVDCMHQSRAEDALECRKRFQQAMQEQVAANLASAIEQKEFSGSFDADEAEDMLEKSLVPTSEREDMSFSGEVGRSNQEILIRMMYITSSRLLQDSISAIQQIKPEDYEGMDD